MRGSVIRDAATKYLQQGARAHHASWMPTRSRAQILEQIGDVERARARRRQRDERLHRGAGSVGWCAARRVMRRRSARLPIRRGVLLSRLEREHGCRGAFELAMQAAPDNRETYAQILVVLGGRHRRSPSWPTPSCSARSVSSPWSPSGSTYFSLWVKAVAGRVQRLRSGRRRPAARSGSVAPMPGGDTSRVSALGTHRLRRG